MYAHSHLITSHDGPEQVQKAAFQTLLQVLALLEALWNEGKHTQRHTQLINLMSRSDACRAKTQTQTETIWTHTFIFSFIYTNI